MTRDTSSEKITPTSKRLDILPLVHPLRLYLDSGTGLSEALRRLSTRVPSSLRLLARSLAEATARGESLADALKPWAVSLPPEVVALLVAGEATGRLPEILRRIETHLQAEAQSYKHLIGALTWPVLQSLLAMCLLLSVGLFQVMLGAGGSVPVFGWSALFPFLLVTGAAWVAARNWRRLPGIGSAWVLMARARLAGTLGLALDSGLSPRKAIDLAVTAADHNPWSLCLAMARKRLRDGMPWHDVLIDWPDLSPEFMVAVENGETTGQLPECLARQALIDHDQGERLMAHALQVVAGIAWMLSAGAIVFTIIRFYLGYLSILTV